MENVISSTSLMPNTHRTFWLPAAIVAAFVAVAAFAIITYINTLAIRESEQVVTQAYAVREATQQTLSAMRDAETGQRGYLLTGKPNFLQPHESGTVKAIEQLADLNRLTADDDEVRPYVESMGEWFKQQEVHLAETIAMRRKSPDARISDEILDLVKSGRGQAAMDGAREAAQKILNEQDAKLAEHEASTRERTVISRTTITIGNLLALGLISIAGLAALVDRRKRDNAEQELLTQQNELRAVVESAFEGIITYDDDMTIRHMNPAAIDILRIDPSIGDECTWRLLEFFPEEQRESIKQHVREFNDTKVRELSFKGVTMLRSDGNEFLCNGKSIRTVSPSGHFMTMKFLDVSETQILKAREREYALILGQVQEAIVVCDLEDQIQSWNGGAVQLFNISEADAVRQNVCQLLFRGREVEWEAGRAVVMAHGNHATEFSQITSDGRELVIEKRRSMIFDDEGIPIAQLLFMIDVTQRVREEAKERRSQRLESIGTLAGGVAHDLNNVLTPIVMSAKLLKRGSKSPERLMDNIINSADRGARMIQKLLAFAGGEKSDRKQVDVRETLSELEEILSHTLTPTIELHVNVPATLRTIDADSTELSQVVMNLAINARDAMPNGGRLVIEVEDFQVDESRASRSDILKAGSHILLTISDTGEGISDTIIDRIFDPFFTTKAQGKGTGLGLATTIGIVRSYGGDITVYSELGIGTKFSILLPSSESTVSAASIAEEADDMIPAGNGETVLIVDDEPMILETAQETLESNNYRVLVANSGTDALAMFQQHSAEIDCVLLDMMMPGMDGFQTKEALRGLDASVRIIASSGLRRPGQDGGRLLDIEGFLAKPYTDEQLLRLVRKVIDQPHFT